MAYTALDILDKVIQVTEKKKNICNNALKYLNKNTGSYILIIVLLRDMDKSIEYYKKLKKEFEKSCQEEIDFVIYDKISFLINEFNAQIAITKHIKIKSILNSCLNFQRDILALYIDIQGRVIKEKKDVNTYTYKVLENMIIEKEKNINKLERFSNIYG